MGDINIFMIEKICIFYHQKLHGQGKAYHGRKQENAKKIWAWVILSVCSDWNIDNMKSLNYNEMYEYLYAMKYREQFPSENYPDGIPKDEFEHLIMEYLPVTAEEIESYVMMQ